MIKHSISPVPMYVTENYNLFLMIQGNRPIDLPKVDRTIEEIQSGNDMLEYCPILVTLTEDKEKLKILDGQHRFFICKKLKRPVYYIIVKEKKSMADVARINSNVKKWTNADFVHCYMTNKDKNYVILRDFIEKYKFPYRNAIMLLGQGVPSSHSQLEVMKRFQEGKFVATYYDKAVECAEDYMKFSKSGLQTNLNFMIAINQIKAAGKITIDELAESFHKNPDMLVRQISTKKFIYCLEEMYNYRLRIRKTII